MCGIVKRFSSTHDHLLENQCGYFDDKLRTFGLGDDDRIALTTLAGDPAMSVADFRRWMREYALSVVGPDR